jgi:hypothetical protein
MSIRKVAVPGPSLAFPFLLFLAMALCFKSAAAQNVIATADISDAGTGTSNSAPAAATAPTPFAQRPWEIGPVIQSGFGTNDRLSFHFFMAGVHVGKVLTASSARNTAWAV